MQTKTDDHRERRRARLFGRGDIKYVILDLLLDQPRHGYDIMRVLEDRFGGLYVPSAGTVYPTLELLSDMGCVTDSEVESKRVFAITEQGRAFLQDHREIVDEIRDRMRSWWSPSGREAQREMRVELRELFHLLGRRHGDIDPDRLKRARELFTQARAQIEMAIEESDR